MKEVNSNYDALKRNLTDLMELKHVLSKTSNFFDEVGHIMCIQRITRDQVTAEWS